MFSGLHRNYLFISIIAFTVLMQWFLVEHGGEFTRTVPLTRLEWTKTILLGALSLPLGAFMRMLPVSENENDYAPMPALTQKRERPDLANSTLTQVSGSQGILTSTLEAVEEGLSFTMWAVLSVLIPVFVCILFRSTLEIYVPSVLGFIDMNAVVAHPLLALLGVELTN